MNERFEELLALDLDKVDVRRGLAGAVVVLITIAFVTAFGHFGLTAGLAALFVIVADQPGPVRQRWVGVLVVTLVGSLIALIAVWAGTEHIWVASLLTFTITALATMTAGLGHVVASRGLVLSLWNTVSLANGCVCCEIRDDLMRSLSGLLEDNPAIDHVIIEASGIADPEGVATTLVDPRYERLVHLDTITCVVDADTFLDDDAPPEITTLKMRQIGFADLVVLSKVDLVGAAYADAVRQSIAGFAPRLSIVSAVDGNVPLQILLSVDRFDASELPIRAGRAPHAQDGPGFDTFHYRSFTPLSPDELTQRLRSLPSEVFRVKGIVLPSDDPARRAILQAVGMRSSLTYDGAWGTGKPRTDIVVIGAKGMLDEAALQHTFDACRVPHPVASA